MKIGVLGNTTIPEEVHVVTKQENLLTCPMKNYHWLKVKTFPKLFLAKEIYLTHKRLVQPLTEALFLTMHRCVVQTLFKPMWRQQYSLHRKLMKGLDI